MGFKAVYETLKEIFPQLDARILKAVAIEHSKDVDAAINDVLAEVIPYLYDKKISPSATNDSSPGFLLDKGDGKDKEKEISNDDQDVTRADLGPPEQNIISFDGSFNNNYVPNSDKAPPSEVLDDSQSEVVNFYDANDGNDQFYTSVESAEFAPNINYTPSAKSSDALPEDGEIDIIKIEAEQPIDGSPNAERTSLSATAVNDSDATTHERIHEVEPCVVDDLQRLHKFADLISPSGNPAPFSIEFESEEPLNGSTDPFSKLDCSFTSDIEEESIEEQLICNSLVTQSDQTCKVDFLEEMIEAAKNNKKTLFSAMETVINKMKEVEMREKAVEQAQKEAANGGLEIMLMVEELKNKLVRAKEANNMHAGEVQGEKAILATEARELQSRLLNLSDERDKYLQILNEMCLSIEIRLATAEEMINTAEQEKMQKEEHARKSLAEQEALKEKIVMESMMLRQVAEENSKLQEFLMNRGRIVDTLQGEISVICQDVKMLKEKFNERVPFSKSLFSSQTSCILASSASSSQKSTISDSVRSVSSPTDGGLPDSGSEKDESFHNSEKRSPCSSIDGSSLDHRHDLEKTTNEDKALLGDGWDLVDAVSDRIWMTEELASHAVNTTQ